MFTVTISYLTVSNLPWPNISDSRAVFFFITLDFAFTTRCIHNWVSFLLWPSHFILFGATGNCPALFPSSILDTFQPGGSFYGVTYVCLFIPFMGFSWQGYQSSFPFPPPVDHVLSELSIMTNPSWVILHGMAHSFIELCKPLCHDKLWSMKKQKWDTKH